MLNRNLGDAPAPGTSEDGSNEGRRQGRRGGGRGGGGVAGGIGRGGVGGYGGGQQSEAEREDNMARRQAMMSYIRTFSDAAKQLTVVVHENAVSVTDDDGRVLSLPTDGKKVDERVENGLVKISRRNHWDTNTLVSEIDVENGPKIVRSYALSPGGTQLQITTSVNGGPRQTKFTRVYERPIESKN